MGGHVARIGEIINAYSISIGKSEGKRSLGRPRCRGEDNIKMDVRGIGWMHVTQDKDQWRAVVNTVMNVRVP
jgi:hypothetical protein